MDPVDAPIAPAPPRPVALVNRVGEVVTLPPEEAQRALQAGYRPATLEEWKAADATRVADETQGNFQQRYGGAGGALAAADAGVARALTGGLSDIALQKLAHGGEAGRKIYEGIKAAAGFVPGAQPALLGAEALAQSSDPENVQKGGFARGLYSTLRGVTEANPNAATAGEVAGYVAPALIGAPGLGNLAEGAASRAIGQAATSTLGRAAETGLKMAARGAVEGGLMGAQQSISEDALGDHELNGEKLASSAVRGALTGGAIMGALGAGGSLLSSGTKALGEAAARRLAGAEPGAELSEVLGNLRNQRIVKAIGGDSAAGQKAIGRLSGGAEQLGNDVAEQLEKAGIKSLARENPEGILAKLEERQAAVGKELGDLRGQLDAVSEKTGVRPDKLNVRQRIFDEVIRPLDEMPGMQAPAENLTKYADDFLKKIGEGEQISFTKWNKFRQGLDTKIKWNAQSGNEVTDGFKQIRRILEDEYERSAEEASNMAGSTFQKQHTDLKRAYSSMKVASEMLEKQVSSASRAGAFGLSDYAAAAAVGGGPAGIAAGIGKKLLREKGNQILADVFGRMQKMAAIAKASTEADNRIAMGIQKFVSPAKSQAVTAMDRIPAIRAMTGRGGGLSSESFHKVASRIGELASNPAALTNHMSVHLDEIAEHAPRTSTSTAAAASRAVQYLQQMLPKPQNMVHSLQPQFDKPIYAQQDMAKFAQRFASVLEPESILDEMRHGRLTSEMVEAVREVYPKRFAQIQQGLERAVAEAKRQLPYQRIVQLSLLFDTPLDGTMKPDFIRAVQATFQQQQAQPTQGRPRPSSSTKPAPSVAAMATPTERLEARP